MLNPWFQDPTRAIHLGDSLAVLKEMPSKSVQAVVTSPPYWALRDYGVDGQLGLEATPGEYIVNMVTVLREVRRVMRDDATLWLNIGDSYVGSTKGHAGSKSTLQGSGEHQDLARQANAVKRLAAETRLKSKDLVGIPWMLALALRDDGWYLRSEVIWHKRSPMPESVRDRPTKSHEQVFLLTKKPVYFYDYFASQEATTGTAHSRGHGVNLKAKVAGQVPRLGVKQNESFSAAVKDVVDRRNMRSVWSLSTYPLKSAHFAAFPPELVRRCLSAAVSEVGCCPACGESWTRVVKKIRRATRPGENSKVRFPQNWSVGEDSHSAIEHNQVKQHPKAGMVVGRRDEHRHETELETSAWKRRCKCQHARPVPSVVLDLFHGAGTTMKVCERLGVDYVGIDLSEEYLQLSMDREQVYFPGEKRPKKSKVFNRTQMELEFDGG